MLSNKLIRFEDEIIKYKSLLQFTFDYEILNRSYSIPIDLRFKLMPNSYKIPQINIIKYENTTSSFFSLYDLHKYIPLSYKGIKIAYITLSKKDINNHSFIEVIKYIRKDIGYYDTYENHTFDEITIGNKSDIIILALYNGDNYIGSYNNYKFIIDNINELLNDNGILYFTIYDIYDVNWKNLLSSLYDKFCVVEFNRGEAFNNISLSISVICKDPKTNNHSDSNNNSMQVDNKITKIINKYHKNNIKYLSYVKKMNKLLVNDILREIRINKQIILALTWAIVRNFAINYISLLKLFGDITHITDYRYEFIDGIIIGNKYDKIDEIKKLINVMKDRYILIIKNMDIKTMTYVNEKYRAETKLYTNDHNGKSIQMKLSDDIFKYINTISLSGGCIISKNKFNIYYNIHLYNGHIKDKDIIKRNLIYVMNDIIKLYAAEIVYIIKEYAL